MNLRPRALLLAVLTVILAVLGEWNGGAALARLWALPAGLLLLGLAVEALRVRRVTLGLTVRAPAHWPLARPQPVAFEFLQRGRHTLPIEVVLDAPGEFTTQPRVESCALTDGVAATLRLIATPRRLGQYAWPAPLLRAGGMLSLAWWSMPVSTTFTTTVIPDMASRFDPRRADQAGGAARNRVRGSGTEVLQLRDYRPLDPVRLVDWKASARRGRLISREYSEDQHLTVMIAIDAGRASGLGAGELDRLSLYATVAARLAQRATQFDDAIGLLLFAAQPLAALAPARGQRAVTRMIELLTACRVQPSESNPVVAAAHLRALLQRRSLIVLLTDVEDAFVGEQLGRAVRLLTPKHLSFIAALGSERIAALPRDGARDGLAAYRAVAAQDYAETLAGNLRALKNLGAATVMARPGNLDHAVLTAYQDFRDRRRV